MSYWLIQDCKGNEEIPIFKPIRRGGCYKSEERIDLFLRWLFCRIIGLYGKRWMVETVFSVIKRRFGDRIKSRSPYSKFVQSHLIPVAYYGDSLFLTSTLLTLLHLPNNYFQQSIFISSYFDTFFVSFKRDDIYDFYGFMVM